MSQPLAGRDIGHRPVIRTFTIASTRRPAPAAPTPSTAPASPVEEVLHRGS